MHNHCQGEELDPPPGPQGGLISEGSYQLFWTEDASNNVDVNILSFDARV